MLSPRQARAKAIHEHRQQVKAAEAARRQALEAAARHTAIARELLDRHPAPAAA